MTRPLALPLCLALLLLLGAGSGPPAAPLARSAPPAGDDPPADRPLREQRIGGRRLLVQDGVSAERVDWVRGAWDVAETAVASKLGLPAPRDPLALYLFADQDEFRHQTSHFTGLPLESIGRFEGGRSYSRGERRGIYLDVAALQSPAQAAHLVAHEMTHLAERDTLGSHRLPLWLSEGLAEYVGQDAMARVDPTAAAGRRWRRAAVVASAIHRQRSLSLAALSTADQWDAAALGGTDRLIYAEALAAVDWLVAQAGDGAPGRLLAAAAEGRTFDSALATACGLTPAAFEERFITDLRRDLPPRYPVGVHVTPAEGPPGTRFQFAAVGLPPGEQLVKRFVRDDGRPARSNGDPSTVGPAGAAYWSFQSRSDGTPATWTLTVEGDRGTRTTTTFRVVGDESSPVGLRGAGLSLLASP